LLKVSACFLDSKIHYYNYRAHYQEMKLITICIFAILSIATTVLGQSTTYSSTVNSNSAQNYSVNIEITLTGIIPVQSNCTNGYNYNVGYDYDIQIVGGSNVSLYNLAGYLSCGSNQGIYFNLPNNGGSGNGTTQGNTWNNNPDCLTATVQSLLCDSITIVIEGNGIPNQSINLFPTPNVNAAMWDINGNNADSTHFIGTTNQTALKFKSSNIERLRITEDGKVGIGTPNPSRELEVLGNTELRGDLFLPMLDEVTSLNSEEILFLDENNKVIRADKNLLKSLVYELPSELISLCDLDGQPFQQSPTWSNDPFKIFSLCPDVNIGIGTFNPQKLLDVNGVAQTKSLIVGRESSNFSLISGFRGGIANQTVLSLGIKNTQPQLEHEAFNLKSGGELSLNYKQLSHYSTGQILTINSEADNVFKINDEGNVEINYLGSNQALTIRSNSENRKILQLENDGLLRARRIKVDLDNWADFVFEENYQLMPLQELKEFVDINKHLPNVPSEKEIQ